MIRSKDVNKELKKLDDMVQEGKATDTALLKGILKGVTLLVKLMRDVRTNQVLDLESRKVELIKETRPSEKEEPTKE